MKTDENMCPHCNRKWYKQIGKRSDRNEAGRPQYYYRCECLICHQYFDMEQWRYIKYDKEMRRLDDSDKDIAELLINKEKCVYCEHQAEKSATSEIDKNTRKVMSEIYHCRNSKCEKVFYVPKSIYDKIKLSKDK